MSNRQAKCILCEIEEFELIQATRKTRASRYAIQLVIKGKWESLYTKYALKALLPCEAHFRKIIELRKNYRDTQKNAVENQRGRVRASYEELTQAHLKYTDIVINFGMHSPQAKRAKIEVTHLKKVWGQRKRRLQEMESAKAT